MPTYTFRDKTTGEEFNIMLTVTELMQYTKDNPDKEQLITSAPPLLDSVRLGITKPDAGFQKHVLGRIKAAHPGGEIGNRHFNIPTEI